MKGKKTLATLLAVGALACGSSAAYFNVVGGVNFLGNSYANSAVVENYDSKFSSVNAYGGIGVGIPLRKIILESGIDFYSPQKTQLSVKGKDGSTINTGEATFNRIQPYAQTLIGKQIQGIIGIGIDIDQLNEQKATGIIGRAGIRANINKNLSLETKIQYPNPRIQTGINVSIGKKQKLKDHYRR